MIYTFVFIGGLIVGAVVVRVLSGLKLAEFGSQIAVLNERVASRDALINECESGRIPELRNELSERDEELSCLRHEIANLREVRAQLKTALEKEREASVEKLALLNDAREKLTESFKALSSDALKSSNTAFLELANNTLQKFHESAKGDLEKRQGAIEQMVKPVGESLRRFDSKIQALEKERTGAYEGLNEQVKALLETQMQLRSETSKLVKALGTPHVRGRWGEIQLKRVVEIAGMLDYCDFKRQESIETEDGRLRPDLIVKLPGGKQIVVDAKAPLAGYLEAIEAVDEETRLARLDDHARHIRTHMRALSRKSYWDQFADTPEFVVLFLPGETFFSAALERDPSLIEQGVEQRVILATPTTLITLLRAVAYGWRQEKLAENAHVISELGKELYKRIGDMSRHFSNVGMRLGRAVESYNKAVGSLETRVLVTARRFEVLESSTPGAEIQSPSQIEAVTRELQSPEMDADVSDGQG